MESWFSKLDSDDLEFIKKLVLASGSLKDLAAGYGVTYPTIRLRLDRLINKIQLIESMQVTDEYEQLLRLEFAGGKISEPAFEKLLRSYRDLRVRSEDVDPKQKKK